MNQDLLVHVAKKNLRDKTPKIDAGMTVKVSQKIREGEKERVQNFEGLVIANSGGSGIGATFTVRRIVGGVGVEKIFPLHGKNIVKIEIIKKAKVRRSKLYYARGRRGKAARMSETYINEIAHDEEADKKAAAESQQKKEAAAQAEKSEAKPAAEGANGPAESNDKTAEKTAEATETKPATKEEKPKAEAKAEKEKPVDTKEEEKA
ncbi:MAG: 50S ribosomal protein L19 [Candidatus Peribacteraceae bacterium]|nr:50S ribosomal protein L19 [Candidatus Peribacteraceae bacterium]